ncbi:MAG: Phage major capsid protein, partial [Capsulimonas sp.]|nr:Phage major capsid protein [Capsulimonas sp.]
MRKALEEKFREAMTKADAIRLKYEGKSETMTGQEEIEWSRLLDEADTVKAQIERLDKAETLKAFGERTSNALPAGSGVGPVDDKGAHLGAGAQTKAMQQEIIKRIDAQGNRKGLSDDETKVLADMEKKAFGNFLRVGLKGLTREELVVMKAYQADSPASGGFLVTPQQFVMELITLMKDLTFMRGLATLYNVDRAEGLGIPSLDVDPADPDWTSELATGNEETSMIFGKRELRPHPLAKRVKLSNKLLRQ